MAESFRNSTYSLTTPPCISTREIAVAITDDANNNSPKVIGLPYFSGEKERSQTVINVKRQTSAYAWIKD